MKDKVRFCRPREVPGLELVEASYRHRSFPIHRHEEYVIGVATKGMERLAIRGELLVVREGDFILIEPGEAHANQTVGDEGVTYRVFYVPATVVVEFYGHHRFPRSVVSGNGLASRWADLHRQWIAQGDSADFRGVFVQTLGAVLRATDTSNPPAETVPHLSVVRAKAFLDEHFTEPVSLGELAKESGLSRFHLLRSFRNQVGITPGAYQIQLRVLEARRQLRAGAAVADVAVDLGFADQSHLSRHFQRVMGISPGRYAQQ